MEHSFWASRWQAGQIGFHLDRVNPNLPKYWDELMGGVDSVLVPLCGKSLDLVWLAERGHVVRGVEFVREAVEEFFVALQESPQVTTLPSAERHSVAGLELYRADFFRLSPEVIPRCAGIYDRAALVAIAPERRAEYFRQLRALSAPGARLMLVNFAHDIGSGPPFSIPETELREAAAGCFSLDKHAERDILEHEPRFAERGATFMLEQVWSGTRID